MTKDQFGVLPKRHKSATKDNWKRYGLIMDNFEEIYERYLLSVDCEKCGNEYKSRKDRHMDHTHTTGEFRNILCQLCNMRTDVSKSKNNTSGHANICTLFDKRWNIEYWHIRIWCNGKQYQKYLNKTKYTIEEAVLYRDAMKEDLGIE